MALLDHTYAGFNPSNREIQLQGELQIPLKKRGTMPQSL
jgi:hypothetical protein